jgi:hypothetical protein
MTVTWMLRDMLNSPAMIPLSRTLCAYGEEQRKGTLPLLLIRSRTRVNSSASCKLSSCCTHSAKLRNTTSWIRYMVGLEYTLLDCAS